MEDNVNLSLERTICNKMSGAKNRNKGYTYFVAKQICLTVNDTQEHHALKYTEMPDLLTTII